MTMIAKACPSASAIRPAPGTGQPPTVGSRVADLALGDLAAIRRAVPKWYCHWVGDRQAGGQCAGPPTPSSLLPRRFVIGSNPAPWLKALPDPAEAAPTPSIAVRGKRERDIESAFAALQDEIPAYPPRWRAILEHLCVENLHVPEVGLPRCAGCWRGRQEGANPGTEGRESGQQGRESRQ
jgi:hypothetical protein